MKLKKENKKEVNVDKKKIKNKKDTISKTQVGNHGGNLTIKKGKNKITKAGNSLGMENVKTKKKLKQAVESSEVVKDVKTQKVGKTDSLVKLTNSIKEPKKSAKQKSVLKPSMSSSELLRNLNSTSLNKTESKTENHLKKNKVNNAKVETKESQQSTLKKVSKKSTDDKSGTPEKKKKKFGKVTKVKKVKNEKKDKKSKLKKKVGPSLAEAPKFDEENFNSILNDDNIQKSIKALKKLVKKETDEMKNAIFKDYRFMVDFGLFKIPSAPKRHVKLHIKHSLVGADDDVLFIVKDLQRGLKVDYEPTIHHYEDILREKGIEGIKTIMPFNQLKKEYNSYEMKRKLANLYDYVICDGRIVGHAFGFLGNAFSSKQRCTVFPVRTENANHLKKEIHVALHKTSFRQGSKGNSISIIVGNHKNSVEQVTENILEVIKQLKEKLPGSYPNIRNVTLKVNIKGTSSVPLYVNMGQPPKGTPYVIGLKEQKLNKMKEEAEKILNKFTFTNDGHVQKLSSEEIETRKRKIEDETEKSKKSKKVKLEKSKENLNGKSKENKKKKVKKVEAEPEPDDSDSEDDPDYEPVEINEDEATESSNDDSDAENSDAEDIDADDSDAEESD